MKTPVISILMALNALLFIIIGCDPIENGPRRSDTTGGTADRITGDGMQRHLYVSGISYPEGYDWRRDTAYGHVACNIFLMRDGKVTCQVTAGGNTGVAAAPDRHHIIDGHLYTEHTDKNQTVIQRDGKEILRYQGTESMRGMLTDNGKLLTLGQNTRGNGFSLRRNGKILFESEDGVILGSFSDKAYSASGALYFDEGRVCFSYFREKDGRRTWHFVEDGEDTPLQADGVSEIFDMRTMMGDRYAVAKLSNGAVPVLLSSSGKSDFSKSLRYHSAKDYRLSLSDGMVFFTGEYRNGQGTELTGFWGTDGLLASIVNDCRRFRYRDGRLEFLRTSCGKVISATYEGDTSFITGEWRAMTPQCLCWAEDGPVVALTAISGNESPAIWRGGTYTEVEVNGFLTGAAMGN